VEEVRTTGNRERAESTESAGGTQSAAAAVATVEEFVQQLTRDASETRPRGSVAATDILAALSKLRALQEQLAAWEPLLIGAARVQGASWAAIAPALGVGSRQAAERRYLRVNPHSADPAGMTGEQRIQAARDRRAGQRAVTQWAHANAADLRRLASQVSALEGLDAAAQERADEIHTALGDADTTTLLGPLAQAEPHLQENHPRLAGQIAAIGQTTARLRHGPTTSRAASDRDRP